jgi:predicted protein tyrosine phosphatase
MQTLWVGLDASQVRSDLVVGRCPWGPADLDIVRHRVGACAVLSVQDDGDLAYHGIDYAAHRAHGRRLGLVMVRSPMRDFDPEAQRRALPDAIAALARLLAEHERVYVHCTAGINRSPLTVLGYLTLVEGVADGEALAMIRDARPVADPYLDALAGCRRDLLAEHAGCVARRALRQGAVPGAAAAERAVLRALLLDRAGLAPDP